MKKFILLLCYPVFGLFALFSATDTLYATGKLSCNTSAKIVLRPISLINGEIPSTVYEYNVNANELIDFKVPVSIEITSISNNINFFINKGWYKILNKDIILFTISKKLNKRSFFIVNSIGKRIKSGLINQNGSFIADFSKVPSGKYFILLVSANKNIIYASVTKTTNNIYVQNFLNQTKTPNIIAASLRGAIYEVNIESSDPAFASDSGKTIELQQGDNGEIVFTLEMIKDTTTVGKFKELISKQDYEELFPNRYGIGKVGGPSDGDYDYYTYESLLNAVKEMSKIKVEIYQREGVNYCHKVVWHNKETGETREMINNEDYNADWNLNKPEIKVADVDYASFCNEGNLEIRKRELAAFFANISHETTGMGSSDSTKTWGLYWREEVAWQTNPNNGIGYVDYNNSVYPPTPGKSYHGRGPIQISWNYNYGQVSEFIYGNKQILLDEPEKILEGNATLGFMTAIWFWMTPQAPKPSCHDVMVEKWQPSADDIAKGRDQSRFGMTINVINGALECGTGNPNDYRVTDRIGFYKRYANIFNVSIENDCNCDKMQPYR